MESLVREEARGLAESLARRDRLIVALAVLAVVILAGLYTVLGVGMRMSALEMTRMARPVGQPMEMGVQPAWSAGYFGLILLMWWAMMVAMMTPSAAPMVLLFTAVKKCGSEASRARKLGMVFLSGYLLAWAGFSLLATALQWGLEGAGLSSGAMMTLQSRAFAGAVLIAAGLYQFSALKWACLRHCRSPVHFLTAHNQPGHAGALKMGAHHGAFCLGCCWALMALLFVGGIMNLYWIVALALYVLLEKTVRRVDLLTRGTGALLIASGCYFVTTGV